MESIWHQTSAAAPRPPLEEDLSAEAAVIGGGMAGIPTAALLEEAGVRTVVLEADRVGSGQTGNTTAKVTSQHGDCYRRLEERLGGRLRWAKNLALVVILVASIAYLEDATYNPFLYFRF